MCSWLIATEVATTHGVDESSCTLYKEYSCSYCFVFLGLSRNLFSFELSLGSISDVVRLASRVLSGVRCNDRGNVWLWQDLEAAVVSVLELVLGSESTLHWEL